MKYDRKMITKFKWAETAEIRYKTQQPRNLLASTTVSAANKGKFTSVCHVIYQKFIT